MSTNKELDNIYLNGYSDVVYSWLEGLGLPFADIGQIIDQEYLSRAGFIANSNNCGCIDLFCSENLRYLVSSGGYSAKIADQVNARWEDLLRVIKEDKAHLINNGLDLEDLALDCCNEYEDIGFKIRVMYQGQGRFDITAGYSFDAPYFRGFDLVTFESEFSVNNSNELNEKLKLLTKPVEDSY